MSLTYHPLADAFPLIEGKEFDELVADIGAHGLREPVVIYEGQILDGRNRYRACHVAGVDARLVPYDGTDPAAFVISANLRRRHMAESQRAISGAKIANWALGQNQHSGSANLQTLPLGDAVDMASLWQAEQQRQEAKASPVPRSRVAEMLNVSERSIASAKTVLDRGVPELVNAVVAGTVAVSTAADVARLPEPEQREVVARGEKEILEAAKRIRAERAVVSREARIEKIAEIAKGNAPLAVAAKFPVIYADPPWRYENPPMGATNRSIENHYPTMSLDEICALPVGEIATDDAILYMWATAPKLAECMQVLTAWGFDYRTNFVWVKDKIGMGYHARSQHEILLVAKRGNIPPPAVADRVSSVVAAERSEHSAKPVVFYELIESFYPTLPKIELFCRSPREGWSVWGNQSGVAE